MTAHLQAVVSKRPWLGFVGAVAAVMAARALNGGARFADWVAALIGVAGGVCVLGVAAATAALRERRAS